MFGYVLAAVDLNDDQYVYCMCAMYLSAVSQHVKLHWYLDWMI
jgi:hypothetical protein